MDLKINAEEYDFKECKEFNVSLIILDPAVRNMCKQNTCGQYGKNHMCPPAIKGIDEWEQEIKSYKKGVIITKMYPLEKKYDMKAMFQGIADFKKTLTRFKQDLEDQFQDEKFLFLGAGSCRICEKCSYLDDEPCRFPEKAYPSLEACGIDVMSLSKSAGVKYNNGEKTVTYIGAVLY